MPTFPTTDPAVARTEFLTTPQGLPPNLISPFDKGFITQRKKEDEAKAKSLDISETTPIGRFDRISSFQPDNPVVNGKTSEVTTISDPNPNNPISPIGVRTFANLIQEDLDAAPFSVRRNRQLIKHGNGITGGVVTNQTVTALPTTEGFGTRRLSGPTSLLPGSQVPNEMGRTIIARPGCSSPFIK